MSILTLITIACSIALVASHLTKFLNLELNDDRKLYMKKFNKTYATLDEELERRAIWENNLNHIQKHNLHYDLGIHSYTKGINQFSDMTHEEFSSIYLSNKFPINNNIGNIYLPPLNGGSIPSSLDWRTKGYVTNVKNQGHCGSCWTFSTTGALEGQHFRKTKILMSLSEQQLVDCNKENYGCNGGWPENAYQYIIKNGGIEKESDYPYLGRDSICKFNKSKVAATCSGYTFVFPPTEDALAIALASNGPLSVLINASELKDYKSGVYDNPHCNSKNLNHAVLLVGYGSNSNGVKYWIVKNSWGTEWGKQGYIWMSRNKNGQCGIALSASFPAV